MKSILYATLVKYSSDMDPTKKWWANWLGILDPSKHHDSMPRWNSCMPQYRLMCNALMDDIQNPLDSGATALTAIRKVELGHSQLEQLSGNAWTTYIASNGVWFEGHHDQGEGGKVSLKQYKLAVQSYISFLLDPEHKHLEIEFPE